MYEPGQKLGVAVSGGADSVCLLHIFLELFPDAAPAVLHIDHGLRGEESRADAEFVRALAAKHGLRFHEKKAQLNSSKNLEEAGRHARREFFSEFLADGRLDRIALGHTRDDQAETVLYRLLRGAGTAGLSAIRPVTHDGIVRPLIETTRAEVESYLKDRGIPWRDDSTNLDRSFARNRIRHGLLPALERDFNPAVRDALARTARLSLEDEEYFASEIGPLAAKLMKWEDDAAIFECSRLTTLPPALRRRLVRYAIEVVKGDLRSIDFHHVENTLALAEASQGSGRLQIPGVDVFRSFEWLRLGRPRANGLEGRNYQFPIEPPIEIVIPGAQIGLHVEILAPGTPNISSQREYNGSVSDLDWDKTQGRLEVRNWRPGDQYRRVGHKAPEKIKNFFQDARIPLWKRRSWPIMTDGNVVLWAEQFGPAAEFAATEASRKILRIRVTLPVCESKRLPHTSV